MKKGAEFEVEGKKYEISYSIPNLAKLEKEIGKSIITLFTLGPVGIVKQADIDFTIAGIKNGVAEVKDSDQAIELIERYCSEGPKLDDLNVIILQAIMETGLYDNRKKHQEKVATEKQ